MNKVTDTGQDDRSQNETGQPDVTDQVEKAIKIVRGELQKKGRWPTKELWPIRRKVLMTIYDRLLLLQASLPEPQASGSEGYEHRDKRITNILKLMDGEESIPENAAWDVADALKELLPKVAPPEYVYWALVEEKGRKPDWAYNWDQYFKAEDLDKYIRWYEENAKTFDPRKPSARLVALYRIRDGAGRHDRAREALRRQYLKWVSVVLGASAVILLLTWFWTSLVTAQPLPYLVLAAVSGAVGAVLSGTLSLRKQARIIELQAVWKTLLLQVVLGATLAIIVVLVLQTDLIQIANLDLKKYLPAEWFVVGLVSGFSEPFALGILKRISSLGEEAKTP
jgi:hypothetical protein